MNHPSKDELRDFLNDSLDKPLEQSVATHLERCSTCKATVEDIIGETLLSHHSENGLTEESSHAVVATTTSSTSSGLPEFKLCSKFLITAELARGGMGVVYRAFDRELQREVAIKILSSTKGTSGAARFYREAQITGQLQHPGIVPVYELGQLRDGLYFIAMKMIEGQTLLKSIRSSERNLSRLLDAFGSICQAMDYAHSRNIIHRDLKPENVMIGPFGEVQVMDWGLGRKLESPLEPHGEADGTLEDQNSPSHLHATHGGAILGTPAYISPEQARGERADTRADVFAMGGILFEILTGEPPFDAPTATAAVRKSLANDLQGTFDRLERAGVDEHLSELVKSCLAAEPDDRPLNAHEVNRRFSEYLEDRERKYEAAKLEKARTAERLIAQKRRNKQLVWSSAIVVATLLASIAAGYLYLTEKNARVENMANAEREAMQRRIDSENQVRKSIASARGYQAIASTRLAHEQLGEWLLAVKEIEKAAPFATTSIDSSLRSEFGELQERVRVATAAAKLRRKEYETEKDCCEVLFELAEHSFYPTDLRLCKWVNLTEDFEKTFARTGIQPGIISQDAITRLRNSTFRTELLHGLMVWNRELAISATYDMHRQTSFEDVRRQSTWLAELLDQVDTHPLRTRIRQLERKADARSIVELTRHKESVDSLLTVHAFAIALNSAEIANEDRVTYLLKAHQRFPKDFFANWYLPVSGGGLKSQREFAMACYSLRPKNPAVLFSLGRAFIDEDQPHRAIEAFEQLIRVAPWYQMAHRALSEAYELAGEEEKADKQWEIALRLLEEVRPSFSARIEAYRISERAAIAEELEQFLASCSQRATGALDDEETSAKPEMSEESLAEVSRIEKQIVRIYPKILKEPEYGPRYGALARAYRNLCLIFKESGRPELLDECLDKAIKQFRKAAKLAPDNASPRVLLAKLCEEFGRVGDAIPFMEEAVAIEPDYPARYSWLARLYDARYRQHRSSFQAELAESTIEDAIDSLNALSLAAPPDIPTPHEVLARFCKSHKRFDEEVEGWKRALVVLPDFESHRRSLAEAQLNQGQQRLLEGRREAANAAFDQAIEGLQDWVDEDPESSSPHERLSEALEFRGRPGDSMEHLKVAIGIHPKYLPHQDRYARLATELAEQHRQKGEMEEGIVVLTQSIDFLKQFSSDHERLIDPCDLLAKLYEYKSDFVKAIESLRFVADKRPENQLIRERMGQYLAASGQTELADAVFHELVESNPQSDHCVATYVRFLLDQDKHKEALELIGKANSRGITSEALNVLKQQMTR